METFAEEVFLGIFLKERNLWIFLESEVCVLDCSGFEISKKQLQLFDYQLVVY